MVETLDISKKVADYLLQIKAIQLQPQNPFTWASGWKAPIYCDNRIALSFPEVRNFIKNSLAAKIQSTFGTPDYIAGVATAGIAQGALVADKMQLPYVYVRPEPKKHGAGKQIEGRIEPGRSVVVIEDLISTAGSSIKAIKALKEAGCHVKGLAAIFTYGFKVADDQLKAINCAYLTLSDYEALIERAAEQNYVSENDIQTLKEWRTDPESWGGDHNQ